MQKFSPKVTEQLKFYVYLYIDPRTENIFYIGKGRGNRAFSHLHNTGEHDKAHIIEELRKLKLQPRIELLKYGLSEKEALLVEAAAIDLIDIENLTNKVRGHGMRLGARASVKEVVALLDATDVEITDPVLLVNITKEFYYGISPMELYDATRSAWRVGARRTMVKYTLSVYRGIVREVYEVTGWVPGGKSIRARDPLERRSSLPDRWEFVGLVAPEHVRKRYLNKSVARYFSPGSQNPVKYVNCG